MTYLQFLARLLRWLKGEGPLEHRGKSLSTEPTDPALAPYPHCDSRVLHKPGECQYCDMYPDRQAARELMGICFTGEKPDDFKGPCPSDYHRGRAGAHSWIGNAPKAHPPQEPPPVDRSVRVLLRAGVPEGTDQSYRDLQADGMQKDYVVLSEAERAKGFVRPVRQAYKHAGRAAPQHPLLDLTDEQKARYEGYGYVKFEDYEGSRGSITGRYWTQHDLDHINKGCGVVTHMGIALAETYARDPKFYGATFCAGCRKHFPVGEQGEFVWAGTDIRVGT